MFGAFRKLRTRPVERRRRLRCEPLEDRRLLSVVPYVVNSLADVVAADGVVTLREALEAANTNAMVGDAHAGSDTETDIITFALPGERITLGGSQLEITDDLLILGPGADHLTIDAAGLSRVFSIAEGTEAILSGVTITGGLADDGGGIYNEGALTLVNSTLSSNLTAGNGGGIWSSGDLTLISSTLSANSIPGPSGGFGAGIWSSGALYVIASTLSANSIAYGHGAGICIHEGSATITDSIVSDNSTDHGVGGGIYIVSGTVTLTNSTVSKNSVSGHYATGGGGIWSSGALSVISSTISGNSATAGYNQRSEGGGIYNMGTLTVAKSVVTGNSTYAKDPWRGRGGGICNFSGTATITNSILSCNSSDGYGGGIYSTGTLTVSNSSLLGNSARNGVGGGIFGSGTSAVVNSVLAGNNAGGGRYGGGGIFQFLGALTVANSTIAGNSANSGGGGVYQDRSTVTLANSVVAMNYAASDPDLQGPITPESGFNLIGVDPEFVRNPNPGADGTWGTEDDDYGDLRLTAASAAINAGSNALLPADGQDLDGDGDTTEAVPIDLAGRPRVIYGIVDIGAYEYWLAGDVNMDRFVGADDLDLVRANWGQSVTAGDWSHGDASGDGIVGSDDLDIVRAGWGQRIPSTSAPMAKATVTTIAEAERVRAHDAALVRVVAPERWNARAVLAEVAWASQRDQLRGRELARRTERLNQGAVDMLVAAEATV